MRDIQIKTKLSHAKPNSGFVMGGWLSGKRSYLWFGKNTEGLGFLSGKALLRLAKAIVRHFEYDGTQENVES